MKKYVCCFMALCLLLVSGCGKNEPTVVHSDVCPFAVSVQGDQLVVQLDTAQVAGCTWTYQAVRGDICDLGMSEDTEAQMLLIGVKGRRAGTETYQFYCGKDGAVPEHRFMLRLSVTVDEENNIQLQGCDCRDYAGNGESPADVPCPYTWTTMDNGTVALSVLCDDSENWTMAEQESAAFAVGSLLYGPEDGRVVEITPLGAGSGAIVLKNEALGQELSFTVTVGEHLLVTVEPTVEAEAE